MLFHKEDKLEIYNCDCFEYFKNLNNKKIDIVVTSPPYNLNKKYSKYNDNLLESDYIDFIDNISKLIKESLNDNGSYFLNLGFRNDNPLIHFRLAQRISSYFELQNTIIWAKSISVDSDSWGHFIPNNSKKHLNVVFEYIFHFTKNGDVELNKEDIGVPYKDKNNLKRFKSNLNKKDSRCRGNIWFIPHKTIRSKLEKKNHPNIFPEKLVEYCVLLHGYNENTVLIDPFMGIGTALKVCKDLNIYGIGVDLDEEYCKSAQELIK